MLSHRPLLFVTPTDISVQPWQVWGWVLEGTPLSDNSSSLPSSGQKQLIEPKVSPQQCMVVSGLP